MTREQRLERALRRIGRMLDGVTVAAERYLDKYGQASWSASFGPRLMALVRKVRAEVDEALGKDPG